MCLYCCYQCISFTFFRLRSLFRGAPRMIRPLQKASRFGNRLSQKCDHQEGVTNPFSEGTVSHNCAMSSNSSGTHSFTTQQASSGTLTSLLLRLAKTDEEQDWAKFISLQSASIAAICRSHLKDDFLLQDAIQETLLALRDALPAFHPENDRNSQSWINTIAMYVAGHTARREKTRQRHTKGYAREVSRGNEFPVVSDEEWQENLSAVLGAVKKLPPAQRRIVELRYLQGHDNQTIAQKLGIAADSVKNTLSRALANMRKMMPEGVSACAMFELLRNLHETPIMTAMPAAAKSASLSPVVSSKTWLLPVLIGGSMTTIVAVVGIALYRPNEITVETQQTPSVGTHPAVTNTPSQIPTPATSSKISLDDFIAHFKTDHPDWKEMPSSEVGFPQCWKNFDLNGKLRRSDGKEFVAQLDTLRRETQAWQLTTNEVSKYTSILTVVQAKSNTTRDPRSWRFGVVMKGLMGFYGPITGNTLAIRDDESSVLAWIGKAGGASIESFSEESIQERKKHSFPIIFPIVNVYSTTDQNLDGVGISSVRIFVADPVQKNEPK